MQGQNVFWGSCFDFFIHIVFFIVAVSITVLDSLVACSNYTFLLLTAFVSYQLQTVKVKKQHWINVLGMSKKMCIILHPITHMHVYMHVHLHTQTHTNTHTHTHTHTSWVYIMYLGRWMFLNTVQKAFPLLSDQVCGIRFV